MYIEAVPNRNSPPAVLLRETYREDGKIKKRTLLNLTSWPVEQVEGLRIILKGGTALPPGERPFTIARSLPHGHVAAVLGAIRDAENGHWYLSASPSKKSVQRFKAKVRTLLVPANIDDLLQLWNSAVGLQGR